MIALLGVCHKDIDQARRWLEHVASLAKRETGPQPILVVALTRMANANPKAVELKRTRATVAHWHILPDEQEAGYPIAASHLFLRSLEFLESTRPRDSILWLEPDTLPMHPNWRDAIAREYIDCGKPFLGQIERAHGPAHLCGCAVYPPDWRSRAPLLASVLTAPDIFWGAGLGQAFDTWASPETVPQTAEAKTIQQIWRPVLPVNAKWLRQNVRPDVALMHQVKDASGFKAVREMRNL